jgi:pantoate--beta-alanine ligase
MEIIRIPRIVQDTCRQYTSKGRTIGFVPTMGALHEGHLSLIRRAKDENDITVVSIFVNPAQFGPSEDFEEYPRPKEEDIGTVRNEDIDLLFLPDTSSMYSGLYLTYITVETLSDKLCGAFRPGHFSGVSTVITKLFNIVSPTRAYFGQKDYQQAVIIKRLALDLNFDIDIIICPTVRERDGLALSSRNAFLTEEQRTAASVLYKALIKASDIIKSGVSDAEQIREVMNTVLSEERAITETDYVVVCDPETLDEVSEIGREALLAVAARIGDTRLIDNILIKL